MEKMTLSDLDSISNILETEFDDFWNYNILKNELENENSIYITYKYQNEIIGFAGITIIIDTAELNNIVIKKAYRGKGFSKQLLQYLINISKSKNCTKFNLEVSESNKIAINLYKSFGFNQVGYRKNYYHGKEKALLFTKEL